MEGILKIRIDKIYFFIGCIIFCSIPLVFLPKVYLPAVFNLIPFWKEAFMCAIFAFIAIRNFGRLGIKGFLPVGIFCIVLFVGMFHVLMGDISLYILGWAMIPYFMFFGSIFVFQILRIDELISVCVGAISIAVIGGLGLIWDFYFGTYRYLFIDGVYEERTFIKMGAVIRPGFLFSSPTTASLLMALVVGILLISVLLLRNKAQSNIIVVGVLCALVGVFVTYARVGYAGVSIYLLGIFVSTFIGPYSEIRKKILLIGALSIAPAIISAIVGGYRFELIERLKATFTGQAFSDLANVERLSAWHNGLENVGEHFFSGKGLGMSQGRLRAMLPVEHYESAVLGVFVEGGVVVFGCMAIYVIYALGKNLRFTFIFKDPIGLYCLFLIVGTVSMAFVNPIFSEVAFSVLFGLILSICMRWPDCRRIA